MGCMWEFALRTLSSRAKRSTLQIGVPPHQRVTSETGREVSRCPVLLPLLYCRGCVRRTRHGPKACSNDGDVPQATEGPTEPEPVSNHDSNLVRCRVAVDFGRIWMPISIPTSRALRNGLAVRSKPSPHIPQARESVQADRGITHRRETQEKISRASWLSSDSCRMGQPP